MSTGRSDPPFFHRLSQSSSHPLFQSCRRSRPSTVRKAILFLRVITPSSYSWWKGESAQGNPSEPDRGPLDENFPPPSLTPEETFHPIPCLSRTRSFDPLTLIFSPKSFNATPGTRKALESESLAPQADAPSPRFRIVLKRRLMHHASYWRMRDGRQRRGRRKRGRRMQRDETGHCDGLEHAGAGAPGTAMLLK